MNTRWEHVKQIVHDAAELPAVRRKAFVEKASHGDVELMDEVESLLASFDEAEDFLEDAPVRLGADGDSLEGRWIGEYHVKKLIGSGGMGSVYLASKEIDGFPMQVALKFIRFHGSGDYVAKRFRMEQQILARLTHENILRMLDCGVSQDGLPYLVTEYLDSQNLEEWLAEKKPSLKERLELFLRICDAVSYAHRNLIVHGDLKPGNILVTRDGVVKLVDFGIARLMKTQEMTDGQLGEATITITPAITPWWASPEQLRGEALTVDCDCYALGRILFLLLADKPAFDFSGQNPQQILSRLSRETPPRPSGFSNDPAMVGDLDNIARKALEFERQQRYRTVDALVEDIERYLTLRPVSARPYTWTYRFEKFVSRNRGLVATVSVATLALLMATTIALYQANVAKRNFENSKERFDQLRKLANSLVFEADDALASISGATKVRAKLVNSALGYLDTLAKEDTADPQLKEELAAAYEKIGDIQGRPGTSNLGQTARALESYRKSEAIREGVRRLSRKAPDFQVASDHLATIYARLSGALRATGDANGALGYERKALGIRQALFEGDSSNLERKRALASSLTSLSGSLSQLGDWDGVLDTRKEALKMYEEIVAADPGNADDQRSVALALARMGSIEMHQKRLKESLEHYRRALELDISLAKRDPGNVRFQMSAGQAHSNYGLILHRMGRTAEALEELNVGRSYYEEVARADERDVRSKTLWQTNRVNTAKALLSLGRPREALVMAETALIERLKLAEQSPSNAGAQGEVAEAKLALGQSYAGLGMKVRAREEFLAARQLIDDLVKTKRSNAANREALEEIDQNLKALAAPARRGS